MMKRQPSHKLFITAIFLAGLSLVCKGFALIGETVAESDLRYAPLVKTSGEYRYYQKEGFNIRVHFYHGLADNITYRKFEKNKHGVIYPITFEEIAVLLDNNSRGQEWKDLIRGYDPQYQPKSVWDCKNLLLQGYYDTDNETLDILAKDYSKLYSIYENRPRLGQEKSQEKLLNTLGL